jgi:iron(III) transport system ATP-binding protein
MCSLSVKSRLQFPRRADTAAVLRHKLVTENFVHGMVYSFDFAQLVRASHRTARRSRMISVKVTNVTKRFGNVTALDGIDLTIQPGELFFLLGPSGCGKTTLLRSLAGFYIPDAGSIHFGSENVTTLPPHQRNTGMMFQSYALWPHMTVADNVAFGLEERRVPRNEINQRVRAALASVQMENYAARRPNQLSGGQQQRVALARALVIRPRCLLLDEPLSNLDARLRLEMRGEIRRVCKEFNLTTVYVTHDQKEALSIADRMAILAGGKILQVGAPREIYRRPTDRVVANFIGETNFIEGTIESVNGVRAVVSTALGRFVGVLTRIDQRPRDGAKATLSIRPECLHLGQTLGGDANRLTCTVGDAVYLGEVAQYELRADDVALKVLELNPRQLIAAGRTGVVATVDPEDVAVLVQRDPTVVQA